MEEETQKHRATPTLSWLGGLIKKGCHPNCRCCGATQTNSMSLSSRETKNISLRQDVASKHKFIASMQLSIQLRRQSQQRPCEDKKGKKRKMRPWIQRQIMENTCNWLRNLPHSHGKYEQYECRGAKATAGPSQAQTWQMVKQSKCRSSLSEDTYAPKTLSVRVVSLRDLCVCSPHAGRGRIVITARWWCCVPPLSHLPNKWPTFVDLCQWLKWEMVLCSSRWRRHAAVYLSAVLQWNREETASQPSLRKEHIGIVQFVTPSMTPKCVA